MSSYAVIPLLAAIALVALLIVLLLHRPEGGRGALFLFYVIPAILWSLCDFALRSGYLPDHDLILVKSTICLAIWMVVQYHLILRSYVAQQTRKQLLAYLPLAAIVGLAISGYIPRSIEIDHNVTIVRYGIGIVPIAIFALALIIHDLHLLLRKRKASVQPADRNQLTYLLAATLVGGTLILTAFTPLGTAYATAHIGNLATALILIYAMAAHRLLDVGVALRRALAFVWVSITAGLMAVLMLWLASLVLHFELTPSLAIAGVGVAYGCIAFVYLMNPLSRRAVEGIFVGKRYEYRQKLSKLLSNTPVIDDMDSFANQLLPLLSQATDSHGAWLLLPNTRDRGFGVRSTYASNMKEPVLPFSLRQKSRLLLWLRSERRSLSRREMATLPGFATTLSDKEGDSWDAQVEIFFPVFREDRLVAIVALGTKQRGDSYTLEETDLIEAILSDMSASIDKESLREKMLVNEEDLIVFNRLVTVLNSSIDVREAFDRFSEELQKVAPVDWATISLADGEELHFLALSSSTPTPWKTDERIPLSGTGTEWVMKEQKSVYEPDLAKQRRFSTGDKHAKQGIRSAIYLPLVSGGKSIGALIIASHQIEAYSLRQVKLLEQLASYITAPIENSQLYSQAREKARIDELTGLFNRRHFDERLKEETASHARYGGTFSLLMLDLDSFKVYNDIFGHPAGDDLLREVSDLIRNSIRTSDQPFRYGGDEFAIILPQVDMEGAHHVAERMRQSIAHGMQSESTGVTSSIGLAMCPADGADPSDLIAAADRALYCAKRSGRNRVCLPNDEAFDSGPNSRMETGNSSLASIYGLMGILDAKDDHTYVHAHAVRGYALCLAEALGLPAATTSRLTASSLLHDIGKVAVWDQQTTGVKSVIPEGIEGIKAHPRLGALIVANVPSLGPCVPAILYHHERYDGSGYPEGLRGEDIPLEARILALADAFARMTSGRNGQTALSWEDAIHDLRRGGGSRFDPELVPVFIAAMEPPVLAVT